MHSGTGDSVTSAQPQVIYCDNHVLALRKPPGMLTQAGPGPEPSLEAWGKAWVKLRFAKPGAVFLQPVHRLDRPVSGLVLCGRTSKAVSRLNRAIRAGQWHKTYWAVVRGCPRELRGSLRHALVHSSHRARIVKPGQAGARVAELSYSVVRNAAGLALLEVLPLTGRYHQIRVQLASIGCPVVGDRKYGDTMPATGVGIALHHRRLQVEHPVTEISLDLTAAPPDGWPWSTFSV